MSFQSAHSRGRALQFALAVSSHTGSACCSLKFPDMASSIMGKALSLRKRPVCLRDLHIRTLDISRNESLRSFNDFSLLWMRRNLLHFQHDHSPRPVNMYSIVNDGHKDRKGKQIRKMNDVLILRSTAVTVKLGISGGERF